MSLNADDCSKPRFIRYKPIPMINRFLEDDFYQVRLGLIIICAYDYAVICVSSITAYAPLYVFTGITMRHPTG